MGGTTETAIGKGTIMKTGRVFSKAVELTWEGSQSWKYPDFALLEKDQIIENRLEFDNEFMAGSGREILLEGVYIWYGNFKVSSKKPLMINTSASHIQMNFCLQNITTYYSESFSKPFVRFKPYQHNLVLLPQRKMVVQWEPRMESEVFSINIAPEFFFGNLPETHRLYKHFKEGIEEVLPAFLSLRNLPVTPKMISALFEILNCEYSGYHKNLFVKAKVIELLAMQFEQYEELPLPDITSSLKEEDIARMHLAKEILVENLESPPSIKDLAHRVGTNEYNLKKYFKEVFGTTVFGYLHDFRMERSKLELSIDGSKISDVAQRMGYKHATHFTAAFKKYYGFLPNKMRWGLLQLLNFSGYAFELMNVI
ncbi:transcriptional regulator, AraC family [Dyadobacter koreensis]|uniref:Transcriptional regulator, AraC family n=1 Tax=Dyadobacter koreensis TaxID=408657 RepID=A0A1H6UWE0_9BACT|nr:AraC family transcriptional regulator [Dyadobacter koreensis]SEI92650.1 transcriptional regulator, AraC family [Dyadobacter koreensis]